MARPGDRLAAMDSHKDRDHDPFEERDAQLVAQNHTGRDEMSEAVEVF